MISKLTKSSLQKTIYQDFYQCRAQTLALFENMDDATFTCQAHPDFSPVGWHLGHIAYTESLWLLERAASIPCLFPQYRQLFAADGLPKSQRVQLPNLQETYYYLDTVRKQVLDCLKVADLQQQERMRRFLLQHESQHCETISFVLELINQKSKATSDDFKHLGFNNQHFFSPPTSLIKIPAGNFEMGSNSIDALDNERPAHIVYLDTYYIDRYPVTCGQYRTFMEAGGYEEPRWWSEAGWKWLQTVKVSEPLYWHGDSSKDNHPVCGVSWYEAEAYCRFVDKRLPTEAEWEKAVSWDADMNQCRIYPWGDEKPTTQHCNYVDLTRETSNTTPVDAYPKGQSAYGLYDTLGNVWEWTASWFDGYEGFESYPYVGYSQVYFDQQHRVLKGGSWATSTWGLRSSFRNWYHPGVRQIFAGFRCAADRG